MDTTEQIRHDILRIHALQESLESFSLVVSLTFVSRAISLQRGERTESRLVRIMAAFRAVFGSSKESAETVEAGTLERGNLRTWLVALPGSEVSTSLVIL
jgi:2-iminoacetate synthase ThiH